MSAAPIEIPEDVTPKSFYEELLPRMLETHRDKAAEAVPDAAAIEAIVRAEVKGDGGGVWSLHFFGGKMEITATALPDPLVTFVQTRDDWQVSITKGVGRLIAKLAGGAKPAAPSAGMPRPSLTPDKVGRLKAVRGVMNFDLTGYEGDRTIQLKTILNSAEEGKDPTCTISVSAADYQELTSGKLPPQQAFMSGKIRIAGDMAFAMQLGSMFFLG